MLQQEPMLKSKEPLLLANRVRDYGLLMKPNLSTMVVFSSVVGYLLAPGIQFVWKDVLLLFAGGMLVTGGANTINQILERESDKYMRRTMNRPMPDGRMDALEAWIFAFITGISGALLLGFFFNVLAGVLSFISMLLYAFAYTPMKKIHPIAVLIGAIPGALPPLIGWVAATNSLAIESFGGWVLFLIQFFWQFPHFWAIAWVSHDDYQKAGFFMLPSKGGRDQVSKSQILIYTLSLFPISITPFLFNYTGWISATVVAAMGLIFISQAYKLYRTGAVQDARKLMFGSFIYLPLVQLALMLGHQFMI